jgi:hypothetical protein
MDDAGARERRVLLIGSSLFTFSDSGPDGALGRLVEHQLNTAWPGTDWLCRAEVIFQGTSCVPRLADVMDDFEPDFVVFEPADYLFLHRMSLGRLARWWPALYGPTRTVMAQLKRAGGNKFEGATDLRSLIFRLPRQAAFRLIGGDAELDVETATRYTIAMLDEVLRREHVALICSMPKFQWSEPDIAWCEQQLDVLRREMRDYCGRHHVAMYDVEAELARKGRRPGLARDAIHYDFATREIEASLITRAVLASERMTQALR